VGKLGEKSNRQHRQGITHEATLSIRDLTPICIKQFSRNYNIYGVVCTVEKILTKVDERGRILIPKGIREKLMLKTGDILSIEVVGESIVIRPIRNIEKVRARELKEVFSDAGRATFRD